MKLKLSIFVLLFIITFSASAQLNVGKSRSPINLWVAEHKSDVFVQLKNTTAIFVTPPFLEKSEFEAMVGEVWDFNSVQFVSSEEFEENTDHYISSDNLVVRLIDNVYGKYKSGGFMGPEKRNVGAYIVFKFSAFTFENVKRNKKGELDYDELNIAEIFFTPNIRMRQEVAYTAGGKMKIGSFDKINEKYGEEPGFYNFNLGYIKNYFQELNRRLNAGENLKMEDGLEDNVRLAELNTKILMVPEWELLKYNAMAASYGKDQTAEELFADYDHKYQVVPNETLNSKILNGEDFYYLMHTQFNQRLILSIIHSVTGEIIYLSEDGGYNIKDSDLKKISKLIDQAG